MKLKKVFIANYREFRRTVHEDVDAYYVMGNLQRAVEADLKMEEEAHVKLCYAPHYDEEGFAIFDVTRVKVYLDTVEVHVIYTGTAK